MTFIATALAPFWTYIAGAFAAMLAFGGLWLKARSEGIAQERANEAARQVLAEKAVIDARKGVDAKTDDEVRKGLEKWAKS